MTTDTIISKVWSFCNTLHDDGVGYGDYLEQLTYLIFLKMADEYSKPPYKRKIGVPERFQWGVMRPLKEPNWKPTTSRHFAPSAPKKACSARSSPRPKTRFRTPPS
ncbi:type I restriction-modification system subunit M N-terminal domain-containing protein [Pelagicoccus sp. SDUM812002]|nr:type I restriction-modification system subunit M N-terminal domain-containing protein [Pelagicoccus sp. SDUM812002]MDQ8186683.1 type I restriction-modification system subunit M N-terminal domain-containing protein [Pelagicoccus sp. SDUM812002]